MMNIVKSLETELPLLKQVLQKKYLLIEVIVVTVHSNQVEAGRNPVAHWLVPVVLIHGMLAGMLNITRYMTATECKPETGKKRKRTNQQAASHCNCRISSVLLENTLKYFPLKS